MRRNTPPAAQAQAAQASLFVLEPAKTVPVPAAAKPRVRVAVPRPETAMPAAETAKTNVKIAKTNPAPKTPTKVSSKAASGAASKIAKTNSGTKPAAPREQPARVVSESVFEGGSLWRMSGRNGVAYIKDATLAGELLAIDPKKLAQAAMAVYYDKKGKAFAWQVRFDTDRWEEVMGRLG